MKTIFKLSLNNFAAYKKIYIKIICALVALLFLITLISSFTISINAEQTAILNKNISSNYTFDNRPLNSSDVKQEFETIEVGRVDIQSFTDAVYGERDEELRVYAYFALDVDGERYFNDNYEEINAYVAENNVFTENDYKEAFVKDVNEPFLLGRYPQNANEIVLSEQYLRHYDLDRSILGKKITLTAIKFVKSVHDDDVTTSDVSRSDVVVIPWDPDHKPTYDIVDLSFSMEVTVSGIITMDYYFVLSGPVYSSFYPKMLISHDNALTDYGVEQMYICSLKQWPNKETEQFLTDSEIHYAGESTLDRIRVTANLQNVVNQLVLYFGSALIFGIVFTLILLTEKLCSAQMKNSGELLISGLTNRQLFCVWLVQLALAALISVVIASLLTFGAMHGINAIISRTFWLRLTVSTATFFEIMAIGLAAVAVVTVTALGYFALIFRRKQIRDLIDV